MSHSPPKCFTVLLSRQGASVLEQPGASVFVEDAVASDDAVLLAFDCLLKKTGARQVRVLLSSSFVDHVAIPGLVHWLKNSDLVALGRSRLAAFYGTDQVQRKVIVSREGYGAACLAASAGKELLDCLEQTADARQVDIVGIQPLAARAIEVLRKELCGNSALAIVIDEVDALWVGLRANGSWRSIRNLPASALRYSSPLDLLKRECLSAGLSGVEYIYCAASGSADAPVLDWGQDSTDFSDRLRLGGGARRLDLSFREKRGSRMGWYLLGASIIALMGSAYAWRNLQLQHGDAVMVMERQRRVEQQFREDANNSAASMQSDYDRALAAYRMQTTPWKELFATLNEYAGDTIGILDFSVDALTGGLAIDGEAKKFDDVQDFVDRLTQASQFHGVKVSSITPGGEGAGGRARFSLSASWSSGVSQPENETP